MTPNAETGKIVKQFMKASRWIPPQLAGGEQSGLAEGELRLRSVAT